MIDRATVDKILDAADIVDVVSDFVHLRRRGANYVGLCPFHNEKTPSFSVDTESQMYYCFGCHKGGTVINFVMEMERMEFQEAVQHLAERAHMALPQPDAKEKSTFVNSEERERIYEANVIAARYFHSMVWTDEGSEVLNYLYKRGLNDADIRRFGLGASPRVWDNLIRHLEEQGFEAPVQMDQEQTLKKVAKHKLKTDTGIELTIPTDYFDNTQYLEFNNCEDGTISITIKHVASIVNR